MQLTVIDALKAVNLYPLPTPTAIAIALESGLDYQQQATQEVISSKAYKHAKAKVLQWLAGAPNVTEAGATYSFTDAERADFRKQATLLLADANADNLTQPVGYVGEDF